METSGKMSRRNIVTVLCRRLMVFKWQCTIGFNIRLEVPYIANQKEWRPVFLEFVKTRKRIETLFLQLCDQFIIIRNYVKDTEGFFAIIIGKISALAILQYINYKNHCCPEKFYHGVSRLGQSPSGTLSVRSVRLNISLISHLLKKTWPIEFEIEWRLGFNI